VHDADTIDKLGPLGAIRHIWKLSLLGEPDLDHTTLIKQVPDHLDWRYKKLYLKQSKEIAGKHKEKQDDLFTDIAVFEKLYNFINESARNGLPVDRMIPELLSSVPLDQEIIKAVKEHIDLGHVK
jgi:hypothetical protein